MNNEIQPWSDNELIEQTNGGAQPVANPFGGNIVSSQNVGTAQAVSHELAEMQAQIYLAKQFPRDQQKATDRILTSCQRLGLASVAVYSYARGGASVSGPSIRLAEEIARNWGNLECGWNELEREDDTSKIRAFAWDKESNVLKTLFFYVPHYRTTKAGKKRLTDERDIYELLANQAARRMRNCILALIPGDVVDAAVSQCEKTMVTKCQITAESIRGMLDKFAELGVSKKQIEKRIQRNLEAITPAQFVRMREIYTSMKDGVSDATDWFEELDESEDKQTAGTDALKSQLSARAKTRRAKASAQTSVEAPQNANHDAPVETDVDVYAQFTARVNAATTREEFQTIAEDASNALGLTDDQRTAIFSLIDSRAMELDV